MKRIICSFANKCYSNSFVRLNNQIKEINFFDLCYLYNEDNLGAEFKESYSSLLIDGSRGFGYWVWKPHLILKILEDLEEGDTLLYIDAGCHINAKGKKRLIEYFELLELSKTGIIGFQLPSDLTSNNFFYKRIIKKDFFSTGNWTKGDLLDYYDVRHNQSVINSPQIIAGIILIKKKEESIFIIKKWMETYRNIKLIDDSNSLSDNKDTFIENRHDQSVFSILCQLFKVDLMDTSEIEGDPAIIYNNPILALRDIRDRWPHRSFKLFRYSRILRNPQLILNLLFRSRPTIIRTHL